MKKIILLPIAFLLFTIQQGNALPHVSANLMFAAKLTGDQETPPVTTSAYGVASFVLNATRDTVCISVTVRDLSSPITAAHIHIGSFGLSGPPVFDLMPFVSGNRIFATLTGQDLTPTRVADFIARRLYINVHTVNNPSGEIRGQIELETDYSFKAYLDGGQIVPADSSQAVGVATFTLHHDYMYTTLKAQFTGLSGPITTAQLHYGAIGYNGPEVAWLDSFVNGNTIVAQLDNSLFIYDLIAGNIYLNVNTAAYPIGEIRGQILLQSDFAFDSWMNGSQVTPPTPSTGSCAASITFNETMDTVYYDAVFDGLSSPATGAHFHSGSPGNAGVIAVDLTSSINGNHIVGSATGLPANFVQECLLGNIYLDIHTGQYPGGEIRGQVKRNAYEGFTYAIDGMQETPPNPSLATGTGFVAIDPEQRCAHYRMVVNNLSGPINGAHFHQGTPGVAGNIIFDLTPYFTTTSTSTSASNNWTDADVAVPFDSTYAEMFMNNDMYVNFHTAQFASGEVRGNVMQGAGCFIINSIQDNLIADGISIYPVPAMQNAVVNFTAYQSADAEMQIYDVSGRIVSSTPATIRGGENKIDLNVSSLTSGIYVVKILTPQGESAFTGKLVKQ